MVLDPKAGGGVHSEYGSITATASGGSGPLGSEGAADPGGSAAAVAADPGEGGGVEAVTMTQNDLYQRQPLLPPQQSWAAKNGGGASGGGGGGNDQPMHMLAVADFSEDEDDDGGGKSDRLKRKNVINANGVVRIEMPPPLRDEPRFPKEQFKTFLALLICVVDFILTTTSLALVHERVPDREVYGPLPDTFLDNMPTTSWALDVSEILIMISTTATFGVIVFHKHRWIVFRRVFLILSILYLMRSITMYVTVLPMSSSSYYCSPKANTTSVLVVGKRVFQLISGFGLSINGKHTYCGDYIYSGHTVILVVCYLLIKEYSPKRCYLLHLASLVASFTGVILVLVARGHYTVDVLIAYYVTTSVFWIYHTMANHPILKQPSANNHLSRMWWFKIFRYFEGNVGAPIPRQYDWPLPWPKRFLAKHPNRDS